MGNQLAHEQGGGRTRTFGRTGALGLSKVELDKRCQPSGLYQTCPWDDKAIRRLIGDGRLAARLKGSDSRTSASDQECPICFLHYSDINITQCCKANICTECFLQVRPPKERNCVCPFCNHPRLFVRPANPLTSQELQVRQEDEQRVIEARIRARAEREGQTNPAEGAPTDNPTGFGSSLEHDRTTRRAGGGSFEYGGNVLAAEANELQLLRQLSLSSQDRQALEEEMRAQHTHPLALQMEAEAEERRIQNELEYNRTHGSRSRDAALLRARMMGSQQFSSGRRGRFSRMTSEPAIMSGGRGRRDWNGIVDAFERGGNGEVNSLDDLVVLEAAILLSMEEEARRREQSTPAGGFDVNQHAHNGFPLVQEMLSARSPSSGNDIIGGRHGSTRQPQSNEPPTPTPPPGVMDSAGLLLRGVTEDEQVAWAIALSMQDSDKSEENDDSEDDDDDDEQNPTAQENPTGVASMPTDDEDDQDEEEESKKEDSKAKVGDEEGEDENDEDEKARPHEADLEDRKLAPAPLPVASLPTHEVASLPAQGVASMPSKISGEDDDDDDDIDLGPSDLPNLTARLKSGDDDDDDHGKKKSAPMETMPELKGGHMCIPMEESIILPEDGDLVPDN